MRESGVLNVLRNESEESLESLIYEEDVNVDLGSQDFIMSSNRFCAEPQHELERSDSFGQLA